MTMSAPASAPGPSRAARGLAAFAGFADASTGLLLVMNPALVMELLGLPAPAEPVFLRFIGVFVCAVGLFYAWPFLWRGSERAARLTAVLEVTALARVAVAAFVAVAVASGALDASWLFVGVFDAVLAAAQVVLLARGAVGHVA